MEVEKMVVRLYVFAITFSTNGVEKTYYEVRPVTYYGCGATIGNTPSDLAKNLQAMIKDHDNYPEFQHDKEGGGSGALLIYQQLFDDSLTEEGKLNKAKTGEIIKHRPLNEEEIREFRAALQ
jgi:hypothetical protein